MIWNSISQTLSCASGWSVGSTITVTKKAGIVELKIRACCNSVYSTDTIIGSIPTEYRPSAESFFVLSALDAGSGRGSVSVAVNSGGVVATAQPSISGARWVIGTAMFFAA